MPRRSLRTATEKEEALVNKHLAPGETLLGVNDEQNLYSVRQPSGDVRYIDYKSVQPGIVSRIAEWFK